MLREIGVAEPAEPPPAERAEPRLVGAVEVMKPARIAGWAVDHASPDQPVLVECLIGAERRAVTAADRPRKDLERAGVGNGRHGFELTFDPPLSPEDLAAARLRARTEAGEAVPLLPRSSETRRTERVASEADAAALMKEITQVRRALEPLGATLATLAERMDAVESVQARIEMVAARLDQATAHATGPGEVGRGLRWTVAALAVISVTALGLGVESLLRGG